jgi:pyruvate/2-oxoglutarate dehydrogenase complex dihydrolipoamide acyltransferase (E2) component
MADITPVPVPRENVNDETVNIVAWRVASGDAVEAATVLAEIETSKTNFDVEAPCAGFVKYTLPEGAEVEVGGVLCYIVESADTPIPECPAAEPSTSAAPVSSGGEQPTAPSSADLTFASTPEAQSTRFSAKALALLHERGLSADQFEGRGLVRLSDVLTALGEGSKEAGARQGAIPAPEPVRERATFSTDVPFRLESLPRKKRVEARYLGWGARNTLTSSVTVTCRTRGLREAVERQVGGSVTATSVIVFETSRLLRQHLPLNAFHQDGTVCVYDEINIGCAIDAGQGLKVPVVRNADKKALGDIADELQELTVAYLNDELPVESLAGGTFTVTDLSGEGAFAFQPLINQGQSAILGVGAEFFPPGSREGLFNLVLSFDHQVTEGRQAARFLSDLRYRLEGYEEALVKEQVDEDPCCAVCMTPRSELKPRVYMLQMVGDDGQPAPICSLCATGY